MTVSPEKQKLIEELMGDWYDAPALFQAAARSSLEELAQSLTGEGWQPIETAPKDGSRIILWRAAFQRPWEGNWSIDCWTRTNQCDVDLKPTHWQPLPNPPKL